jgi:hypothetical protein
MSSTFREHPGLALTRLACPPLPPQPPATLLPPAPWVSRIYALLGSGSHILYKLRGLLWGCGTRFSAAQQLN